MITAQEAYKIAQGVDPEELKYIEDKIRTAAEKHTTCCLIEEEISEATEQILIDMGYNVGIISLHSGCITYINWEKV